MYRTLLIFFVLFLTLQNCFSQIIYRNYDEGLTIDVNSNYEMDVDNDGTIDFYINAATDEIGFTPVFQKGCFTSDRINDKTTWGAMKPSIHEVGDIVGMTYDNMLSYIEETSAGLHHLQHGSSENWNHNEAQYVGFAVFTAGGSRVLNGWMNVKIDMVNNAMVVLELAYAESIGIGGGSIEVGVVSLVSSVDNIDEDLRNFKISPNPASNLFQLDFDYIGSDDLELVIVNSLGQPIRIEKVNGVSSSYTFDASDWSAGLYTINLKSKSGVHTEKIQIVD